MFKILTFFKNLICYSRFKLRIGDYNHTFDVNFSGALILEITGVHKHPKYTVGNSYYDVAVLTTEVVNATVVMTFSTNVRITRLISSNNLNIRIATDKWHRLVIDNKNRLPMHL